MLSRTLFTALIISSSFVIASVQADVHLRHVEPDVSDIDLRNLESSMGIGVVRFDYSPDHADCIQLAVIRRISGENDLRQDGASLCTPSGAQRLTVHYTLEPKVTFRFYHNRLSDGGGASVSGPEFPVVRSTRNVRISRAPEKAPKLGSDTETTMFRVTREDEEKIEEYTLTGRLRSNSRAALTSCDP